MTNFTIKDHYETKKECANKRGIDFNFTLDQFQTFWALRNKVKCFYTNCNFKMSRGTAEVPKLYPTAERICQSKPYSPDNCVWVTHHSNQMKAFYVEQGQSLQGVAPTVVKLVNKIKKVLENPDCLAERFKVYEEAYKEVHTKNSVLIKQQIEEKKIKDAELAEEAKWAFEIEWSQYYIDISKEFSDMGVILKETNGNFRKIVTRVKHDQVTGEKFNDLQSKKVWVIDKTKPICQGNIKIVKLITQQAMDALTNQIPLDKLALSLHKIQNQQEK